MSETKLIKAFARARKDYRDEPLALAAIMIAAMYVANELKINDEKFDKAIRKAARKL